MEVSGDWLSKDVRDTDVQTTVRDAQRKVDVDRAQIYVGAFVDSPAGRKLLEHWDNEVLGLRVSVNATLSDYVATEAVRNFVRKIHDQIRLAQTEGR